MLNIVSPGTHAYEKYIKPSELVAFFRDELKWISSSPSHSLAGRDKIGYVPHTQAEVRGMTYIPWSGKWILAPRGLPFEMDCNYIFWARKPLSA